MKLYTQQHSVYQSTIMTVSEFKRVNTMGNSDGILASVFLDEVYDAKDHSTIFETLEHMQMRGKLVDNFFILSVGTPRC